MTTLETFSFTLSQTCLLLEKKKLSFTLVILLIHALTNGLLLCLGGSVAISFPVGTEVCSRPCLLLFSVYVRDAHLDIAYSFSLTTYVTCPQKKKKLM